MELWTRILLAVGFASALVRGQYTVPDAMFQALKPRGLRVSIPDEPGIQIFAFHANINKDIEGVEAGQLSRDVTKAKNGRWVFKDDRIKLNVGDVINYWLYVQYEGLGFQKLDQSWRVTELVELNDEADSNSSPKPPVTPPPATCGRSATLVNGKSACQGHLIFEDNFNTLDPAKWDHDVRIAGSPDFEFVAYSSERDNSYVSDGVLHIAPTLVSEIHGDDFITHGKLDLSGCTGIVGTVECSKQAQGWDIIPPVFSARLRSRQHFSFCYGQVEIRAKLPSGDWIFPELWLESKDNWYGTEYKSGRVRLAMARGNKELFVNGQKQRQIGGRRLEAGCTLGLDQRMHQEMRNWEGRSSWCEAFHVYSLIWTPDDMTFKVDGQTLGVLSPPPGGYGNLPAFSEILDVPWRQGTKLAPFDKEFYLSIGLGVGGIQDFPDNCTTALQQGGLHPKPWKNTSPKAMLQFSRDKEYWRQSWSSGNSDLQVDYIKVWAL